MCPDQLRAIGCGPVSMTLFTGNTAKPERLFSHVQECLGLFSQLQALAVALTNRELQAVSLSRVRC